MRRWLIPLLLILAGLAIAALVAHRSRRFLAGALARLGALPLVGTILTLAILWRQSRLLSRYPRQLSR